VLLGFLEARIPAAQANYDLQATIAQQQESFGDLATALTATPTVPFQVEGLDELVIPEQLDESAEEAIERGLHERPDLLAQVTAVRAAEADVKSAKSAYYPTLSFAGHDGWLRAYGSQPPYASTYAGTRVYDAELGLNWTVFDGLQRESALARAKAERAAAVAELNEARDQIADQVWRAYADTQTAFRQRQAAAALLASAQESYSAASEAYTSGVRDTLDVVSAQKTLAQARSADVTSRTQVLNDLAQLAFRTGSLLTNHTPGAKP
jgi:outer membrane protein